MKENGFEITFESFLSHKTWRFLYAPGRVHLKIWIVFVGFARRFAVLFTAFRYDFIFVHREIAPLGPPIFEWIIAKLLRKKIIFDFDDAIWLTDRTSESSFERMLRCRSKVSAVCAWSYGISAGNAYLRDFALQFNPNSKINPTTIDTSAVDGQAQAARAQSLVENDNVIIGWTGSHSTLKYLQQLEGVLQRLERSYHFIRIRVIADQPPHLNLERLEFVPWKKETEIADLIAINVGIMPLPDDDWARGKCGFKALQYMSLGIPAVVSPVGVNREIIQHGKNGFLCVSEEDWFQIISRLIESPDLRNEMGTNGRATVESAYSVNANRPNFLSFFNLKYR
jgi:glycosyltransferase involved in cell wall biosynthesis